MSDDKQYLKVKDRVPEAFFKRLMEMGAAEYGTPYGRMEARGDLTKSQGSACRWFYELYQAYLEAIDGPKGIRTSTGQRIDAGHAPDPFSPIGWEIASDEKKTVKAFDSARLAAMACGEDRVRVFWNVVIKEIEPIGHSEKTFVKDVAQALDKHRTRAWKSRRSDKHL